MLCILKAGRCCAGDCEREADLSIPLTPHFTLVTSTWGLHFLHSPRPLSIIITIIIIIIISYNWETSQARSLVQNLGLAPALAFGTKLDRQSVCARILSYPTVVEVSLLTLRQLSPRRSIFSAPTQTVPSSSPSPSSSSYDPTTVEQGIPRRLNQAPKTFLPSRSPQERFFKKLTRPGYPLTSKPQPQTAPHQASLAAAPNPTDGAWGSLKYTPVSHKTTKDIYPY